jgi:transposase
MMEIYNSAYLVAAKGLSVQEVEKIVSIHTETIAMLLRAAKAARKKPGWFR